MTLKNIAKVLGIIAIGIVTIVLAEEVQAWRMRRRAAKSAAASAAAAGAAAAAEQAEAGAGNGDM